MTKNIKRKITLNFINLLIFIIAIVSINISYNFEKKIIQNKTQIEKTIEYEWRQQAKRTLIDLREQFLLEIKYNKLNPYNEKEVQRWAMININGIRNGGDTGDPFLIKMPDEKFIWDGSPDCAKPEFLVNGRYMKDEAQMHKNPSLALKMLDEMRKMYSTIYENYNYYWEFDNSPELLEWIIIPNDKFGFNEEPYTNGGIKNSKYVSYILVLGTQKDEIMMPYQEIFKNFDNIIFISRIIIIIYFIALIMSLLMIIWYFYNN